MAILKNKDNWLLMLYTGFAFSPVAVFAGLWGNPFLEHVYQIPESHIAWYSSLIYVGLALGAPILGYISDKLDKRRLVMTVSALVALAFMADVIYFLDQPMWLLKFSMFTFGFMSGSFMLGFAIAKEINPIAMAATVVAIVNTGDPIVGSFAEPLIGKILDKTAAGLHADGTPIFTAHGYQLALSSLVVYLLLACIFVMLVRVDKSKQAEKS